MYNTFFKYNDIKVFKKEDCFRFIAYMPSNSLSEATNFELLDLMAVVKNIKRLKTEKNIDYKSFIFVRFRETGCEMELYV